MDISIYISRIMSDEFIYLFINIHLIVIYTPVKKRKGKN